MTSPTPHSTLVPLCFDDAPCPRGVERDVDALVLVVEHQPDAVPVVHRLADGDRIAYGTVFYDLDAHLVRCPAAGPTLNSYARWRQAFCDAAFVLSHLAKSHEQGDPLTLPDAATIQAYRQEFWPRLPDSAPATLTEWVADAYIWAANQDILRRNPVRALDTVYLADANPSVYDRVHRWRLLPGVELFFGLRRPDTGYRMHQMLFDWRLDDAAAARMSRTQRVALDVIRRYFQQRFDAVALPDDVPLTDTQTKTPALVHGRLSLREVPDVPLPSQGAVIIGAAGSVNVFVGGGGGGGNAGAVGGVGSGAVSAPTSGAGGALAAGAARRFEGSNGTATSAGLGRAITWPADGLVWDRAPAPALTPTKPVDVIGFTQGPAGTPRAVVLSGAYDRKTPTSRGGFVNRFPSAHAVQTSSPTQVGKTETQVQEMAAMVLALDAATEDNNMFELYQKWCTAALVPLDVTTPPLVVSHTVVDHDVLHQLFNGYPTFPAPDAEDPTPSDDDDLGDFP